MTSSFIEPVVAIVQPDVAAPGVVTRNVTHGQSTFGQLVTQGLSQVNQQLLSNQADLQNLAMGNVQNLHHVMIRLEENRVNFQLMLQVRNRLLESFQEVMRMQL